MGNTQVIVGGGAAGYFCANSIAEFNPNIRIKLLETGSQTLRKVKISGGGRCNVTHHCFDPKILSGNYPRGQKELIGSFYRWQPRDMISWLEKKGVSLKTEEDGRIFPTSNKSQSIIDCLEQFLKSDNVQIRKNCMVRSFKKINSGKTWEVKLENEETLLADRICIATGSIKGSKLIDSLEALGHQMTLPVPSLFAFNSLSHELSELSGISVQKVKIQIVGSNFCQEGPILITHKGISGPGVIKLSSWAARELYQRDYRFNVRINWLGMNGLQTAKETIAVCKKSSASSQIRICPFANLPKRLWIKLIHHLNISSELTWAHLRKSDEENIVKSLTEYVLEINGKSTNKEEFVTCGGINLKEVNFKTMESKKESNLFFAGECLDIDGVTGGFNFQAAWTTARIAATQMAN